MVRTQFFSAKFLKFYQLSPQETLLLIDRVKRQYIGDERRLTQLRSQRDNVSRTLIGPDREIADNFIQNSK